MLAKIAGVLMLAAGTMLGLKSIAAVVAGIVGILGMTLLVGVVVVALFLGWRLLNGGSALGKIAGAFVLVGGVVAAVPAAMSVVAGTIAALFLAVKIVAVALLLYFGWHWFQSGTFSAPGRRGMRGSLY